MQFDYCSRAGQVNFRSAPPPRYLKRAGGKSPGLATPRAGLLALKNVLTDGRKVNQSGSLSIDTLDAEHFSRLGAEPLVLVDAGNLPGVLAPAVLVAVDREGALPHVDTDAFDALVTTRANAPAPWVSVAPARLGAQLAAVRATASLAPIATATLARVLRINETLPFEDALEVESLALPGGGRQPSRARPAAKAPSATSAAWIKSR
jgi:hypothetical protein